MVPVIRLLAVNKNKTCPLKSKQTNKFIFEILGFLAYLALGKTVEECIQGGAYCGFECIQQSGCTYPEKPNFDPQTFVV